MPTKTVYKIKEEQDGSVWYKARIVTKGFLMIPGVNYTKSFSPVSTEVAVCSIIGISLHFMNEDIVKGMSDEK